jgi:serine/threonine-protein kinase
MCPEQARGEIAGLDEQADVFALGAILCEILTGQPPYVGSRPGILEDAAAGRLEEALARLDRCGAEDALIRLARRCLDPSRAVRPRHAGVVAREVATFLATVAERARAAEVAAAEARATAAAERRARRRTTLLASALGLAIATGVLFAIAAERQRRARAERSIADVAALYRKADWFRDQARHIPPDLLDTWAQALAQVRRTAEIIGAGAIDQDTRTSVARLLDELRREEERVRERARRLEGSAGPPRRPGGASVPEPDPRTNRTSRNPE